MTGYPIIKKEKEKFTLKILLSHFKKKLAPSQAKIVIKKVVRLSGEGKAYYDLTDAGSDAGKQVSADTGSLTLSDLIDRIKNHNVYGFGGAAFPAYRKIDTFAKAACDRKYLIVNGIECDPGLLHDAWILRNRTDEIEKGIGLLKRFFEFEKVLLAVKDAENLPVISGAEIRVLPDRYPMGAERILVKELLDQDIGQSAVPAKEGILILNIQTVCAIYEAVCFDRDADTKFLTIADLPSGKAVIARVKIGDDMAGIAERIFGTAEGRKLFCGGGAMQGNEIKRGDTVARTVNFIAYANTPVYKENAKCSKCGACSQACPAGLKIPKIIRKLEKGDTKDLARLHPELCIGCGACSHSCNADKVLSQKISDYKISVL